MGEAAERSLLVVVRGEPAPQGSKSAFAIRKAGVYTGRVAVVEDAKHRTKPWRAAVTAEAVAAMTASYRAGGGYFPLDGPVAVRYTFTVRRPRGHFGTGRNAHLLRPSAPLYPATRPDRGKLERAIDDALSDAGVWGDDCQVVDWHGAKRYPRAWGEECSIVATIARPSDLCAAPDNDVLNVPGVVIRVWQLREDR